MAARITAESRVLGLGAVGRACRLALAVAVFFTVNGAEAAPKYPRLRLRNVLSARPKLTSPRRAPAYNPTRPLRVMSWNLQYCGGTDRRFFYDGGREVRVPRARVREVLDAVADVIRREDPDVVLLQEVDRRALRTGFIDEHSQLLKRLPAYESHASCWYWRVPWVPHPRHKHLGRVNMHLTVLSKFALGRATRTKLPLLKESRLRRLFNLRRAVLGVDLRCADGECLRLLNTHLSAFSSGDGTLHRQVDVLLDLLRDSPPRWVLAGDFNALAPGVDATKDMAADEAKLYPETSSPVGRLYDASTPVLPVEELAAGGDRARVWFTYKPFQNSDADRAIDHAFVSEALAVCSSRVVQLPTWPSDHLPLLFEVQPEP